MQSKHARGLPLPPFWLVLYFAVLFALVVLFAYLAEASQENALAFDRRILALLYHYQHPALTRFALLLDVLGLAYVLGVFIMVAAVLLWRRSRRSAVFLCLGFFGAIGLNLYGKTVFERLRPELFEQLAPVTNYSFPSGHAMGSWAVWLCGTLVVYYLAPRYTPLVAMGGFFFALAVGVSRCYLQVHYPSDVIAGWLLSSVWVLGLALWYFRPRSSDSSTPVP
jgi:membrane-associated phospholipid phosphatase